MQKPTLVPGWKKAYRWLSMNMMAMAASLQVTWMTLPEDMRMAVPSEVIGTATTVLLVMGMIGRLVNQPEKECPKPDA